MSEIRINYAEVYAKTSHMRRQIAAALSEVEAEYNRAQSGLDNMDGSTAAAVKEAIEANRLKTCEMAETLGKMVDFVYNTSKQVEAEELKIANVFNSSAR